MYVLQVYYLKVYQSLKKFYLNITSFLKNIKFVTPRAGYKFSQPFEPPVEACTSFYIGILAQKAT
jgi:hypothetical protein